jgi:3-hydroxyacyl-CoA dehydrogenase/enoyl-CoA hydratase/3-hydroxybutyryl-CoA epimerase
MSAIRWDLDKDGILLLIMDMPGQPHNTMNADYRKAMAVTVRRLQEERDNLRGIIITSGKDSFFAGAELRELVEATPEQADAMFAMVEGLKAELRIIETLGIPVVAAVNGTALGGGFEIALACHRRIAVNNPKARIGLPETKLGLLPGGGGITRLVRMIGIEPTLGIVLEGRDMRPDAALKAGLIDELVDNHEDMMAAARQWILDHPGSAQPWDQKGFRIPGGAPSSPKVAQRLVAAPAMLRMKTHGTMPAPEAALCAAVEGAQVDFDTASRIESRYFVSLACGKVSTNMVRSFFFQLNEINKGSSRPDVTVEPFNRVGIIGAGMMGSAIAFVAAKAGFDVVLNDVSLENAEKGKGYSQALVDKAVSRKRMTEDKGLALLHRILPSADPADFRGCDLVIEAVFEDRALKARVTRAAVEAIGPDAVMASNTSTLPISGLAKACEDPSRFIGLHFFSPADKMPLVEIITGEHTSEATLARAFDFVLAIRKTPIVVNDSRGFFTSRVFGTYTNEGIAMAGEGVHPRRIETEAAKAGMAIGPLAVSDEVTLTLMQHIREQTIRDLEAEGTAYTRHPADAVIDRMIELKRPGKSSGAGFYDYPEGGRKRIWQGLADTFAESEQHVPDNDIRDRMLYIQAVETVRCMDEGVLSSVADANIGSIFGIGYAPWTGGVLQFINSEGLQHFVDRANQLADRYGERFRPPASLVERAKKAELWL